MKWWQPFFVSLWIPMVEKFVQETSHHYKIDVSHNLHHSQQVRELGFVIAEREYHLNRSQKEILYLTCMLHDMCDAKYIPREQGVLDVSNFMRNQCRVSMMTHDAVMEIITTMSYSHIVKPDGRVEYPSWLTTDDYHDWVEVFHIARQADLLTSYSLKRMIHYKQEKLGFIYSCDVYEDVVKTVGSRMSQLLDRGLFMSPLAIRIARKWHQEMLDELRILTEDDIYPILYDTPEPLHHFQQRIMDAL